MVTGVAVVPVVVGGVAVEEGVLGPAHPLPHVRRHGERRHILLGNDEVVAVQLKMITHSIGHSFNIFEKKAPTEYHVGCILNKFPTSHIISS